MKKHPPKEKPEIPVADIAFIRQWLESEPDWMRVSFEIAILHGTRLRATCIDLERDVDWNAKRITFHEKGGKVFTVPIAPDLLPILQKLKDEGRTISCEIPKGASKKWRQFFDKIGRPQYCFHCCRITTITRLARSGVPEAKAMKFVGHASTEIHRIYQRLSIDDLACCHEPLHLPPIQPECPSEAGEYASKPAA